MVVAPVPASAPSSVGTRDPELLLDGLDPDQREAVTSDAQPLAILAGAGSGKTRVLTHRIAFRVGRGVIDPAHVLAVTFTRKAAGELVDRLGRLGVRRDVTAGTFHSVALAQLRRRNADQDRPMPQILERKVPLLMRLIGDGTRGRGREKALQASELASEIEWAKARLILPQQFAETANAMGRRTPRPAAEVATVYEQYEREKRKRRVVDFEDLIWWCADALENDAEFRAVQQWRFRHLFVDEFQDVSPAQYRLVKAWLGDRSDLCVVGDGDQAVYAFAGANPDYLTQFARHFPGASVVRLGSNYRSSPQVLAAARAVLDNAAPVRTPRPDGPVPTITAYASDDAEARGVADRMLRQHAVERPWSSMAVLYRTNAQSALFEEALARSGIPFRVRGATRFLERPEVKAALESLQAAAKDAPSREFTHHLTDLAEDAAAAPEERREHVEALVRLGREYLTIDGGGGSLSGFNAWLTAALRGDDGTPAAGGDAVELLTFHRAKGLEFDTVFVTGLEVGLVPVGPARAPSEIAEERRLLYVALSRAERTLHLSWARRRARGERVLERERSRWIDDVEAVISPGAAERAGTPAEARRRLEGVRAKAAAKVVSDDGPPLSPEDEALFDALVEWRLTMSRAAKVPAYVIFNNKTLREVARSRPGSKRALLSVPGIGEVKASSYGEAVLEVIGRHAPTG
jgi:DNA helicase-2/ATP-dependent DNA helicase PcrA